MSDHNAFRETIFALSSGRLPSAVAVVRLSGPHVPALLAALTDCPLPARAMVLTPLRDARGAIIDHALVVHFPAPHSFTGEDCAELHLHGGRAVLAAIFALLEGQQGLRHAEPGEFSRRALVNGKFGLTEAEALADLVDARTETQRRLAVEQRGGGHAVLYDAWRTRLLHARAMLEAEIDFADEGDVPDQPSMEVAADIARLRSEIATHMEAYRRAEVIREGFRVAILGAPNVGKSSLLNHLARRDVAIVSDEPGTTRDLLEVELDLDGMVVILTDTAGIRETAARVEQEGIRRARAAAARSDLVLWLTEAGGAWDDVDEDIPVPVLRVLSKADLSAGPLDARADIGVSARSGEGVDRLLALLAQRAAAAGRGEGLMPLNARHVAELRRAHAALLEFDRPGLPIEVRSEELRAATHALGRLVGRVDVEDVLDVVFSRFCIGK